MCVCSVPKTKIDVEKYGGTNGQPNAAHPGKELEEENDRF